jgi:MFS family permease
LAALPVPVIFIYTHQWAWIVFANALLGVSQGLAWSSTVVMKIDLVGEKDRGLAMGLNEFAGYLAMGAVAFLTGYVAHRYGVWPYPFYIGVAIAAAGLLLSWGWVRDTSSFVARERLAQAADPLQNVFMETSFRNKTLSAVTQAGLVNNLNDGMIWGLLPMALATLGHETKSIGVIAAIYPAVWGIGQLFTGKMADIYPRKAMLFWGMLAQGLAILLMPGASAFGEWAALATALGLGTALVYPTFLTVIATVASPGQRAESIGVFRLWRDLGYALGAIVSGITADLLGLNYAIWLTGAITLFSAGVVQWRMPGPGPLHKRK